MSELEQLKEKAHRLIEEETSVLTLSEVVDYYHTLNHMDTPELQARIEAGIRRGLEDVTAGRTVPAEEVFARMRAKFGIRHK